MSKIEFFYKDEDTEIKIVTEENNTTEIVDLFYNFMVSVGHHPDNIRKAIEKETPKQGYTEEYNYCQGDDK